MKYYTENDIEEMINNTYEDKVIKKAQTVKSHADALISEIIENFKDVKLYGGVGLNEAQGLDDYADKETLVKLKENDEKDDWQKIPTEELNRCYSSLSFFDAKGMRFHLPAYMIADIKDEYYSGMAFSLTYLSDYAKEQFSALEIKERKVIVLFLEYMLEEDEYSFDKLNIQESLETYWRT